MLALSTCNHKHLDKLTIDKLTPSTVYVNFRHYCQFQKWKFHFLSPSLWIFCVMSFLTWSINISTTYNTQTGIIASYESGVFLPSPHIICDVIIACDHKQLTTHKLTPCTVYICHFQGFFVSYRSGNFILCPPPNIPWGVRLMSLLSATITISTNSGHTNWHLVAHIYVSFSCLCRLQKWKLYFLQSTSDSDNSSYNSATLFATPPKHRNSLKFHKVLTNYVGQK